MASRPVALFADTLLGLRETSHLILQGDARAALGLVADASVHLIVTSPPTGRSSATRTRRGS